MRRDRRGVNDREPYTEVLAARYGLGERALLRRLPGLERLIAGRRVLFALHHALAARGGALEEWRAWPVPWRYTQSTQHRVLPMDGEGLVHLPGQHAGRRPVGFLWDGDGSAPAAVLSERLVGLDLLCQSEDYTGPRAARVPPVLLVTVDPDRVPPGYRPGLLWTTCTEIACNGILEAAWHGTSTQGDALPLPSALTAVGHMASESAPGSSLPGAVRPPAHDGSARPLRLLKRARTLRRADHEEDSLYLVAVAIPPRGFILLELVGCHPLLSAADIARVADMNPVDAWVTLALVRRHGLMEAWMPPHDRRTRRHVLTQRGLRLLALHAGITPAAYRRVYGVLDDTEEKTRHGLAFARANLAHTDGINRTYLAMLAAARASGGKLEWRGEWACTHTYADGARLHTLRPDAEGTYTDPVGSLHFYLEVDRGTTRLWRLTTKLARYYAYRASTAQEQVTLLLVTSGYAHGSEALRLNETLAARMGMSLLDLRVTTSREVAECGIGARTWRTSSGSCDLHHPVPKPVAGTARAAARLP